MRYHQITPAERYTLATLRKQVPTPSCAEIARIMERHRSTISRELRRNCCRYDGRYRFTRAQEQTNGRRSRSRRNSQFSSDDWRLIRDLLRQDLSPEQVSGRLRTDGVLRVSHETIYKHVWSDKRQGGQLYRHLRQRTRYRKRYGSYEKRGRLAGKRHITERPAAAEHRREFGHWEIDTVIGAGNKHCIVTLVERLTGCVLIGKLRARTVAEANRRITQLIEEQPQLFKSITADNGTEFHGYEQIERATGVSFYFATPYRSWERGTNENTNGLIRQYLPKGHSMKRLTQARCSAIARRLNNRPRKRHGFLSPIELLSRHVSVAVQT
jgi:IS30 family transposase